MNANEILQRGGGVVRSTMRTGERTARRIASDSYGLVRRARNIRQAPKPGMDDVTLSRKVETEIFRGSRAAKASVNVNVVDGVVWLRGEVKRADQIRTLERKARSVPEVRGVENLVHLRKTPAPTRADTPARQQRTRSSTRRPKPRKERVGRVTDDRTDALSPQAEPSPREHASEGEGRSPAPFGSSANVGESAATATESAATATESGGTATESGGTATESGATATESAATATESSGTAPESGANVPESAPDAREAGEIPAGGGGSEPGGSPESGD